MTKRHPNNPAEPNHITIDEVTKTGGYLTATNDEKVKKKVQPLLSEYLPGKSFAHDSPDIDTQCRPGKYGGLVQYHKRTTSFHALNFRFIRIYSENGDYVRMMIIDIDSPNGQGAWIRAGIRKPNLITTNPRTGNCQYMYLLDEWNHITNRDYYKAVRSSMISRLQKTSPHLKVDPSSPPNFRSPCFDIGRRLNKPLVRKGLQTTFHYVEAHHLTPYPLAELDARSAPLDNFFEKAAMCQSHTLYDNKCSVTSSTSLMAHFDALDIPRSTSSVAEGHRNNHMFDMTRHLSYPLFNTIDWNYENVYKIALDHSSGLPSSEVKATAKKVFDGIETAFSMTFDPSKKRASGMNTYDHSAEAQRRRVNVRHNAYREYVGETLIDFAKRRGKSYRTILRWKKSGRIEFIGRCWVDKVQSFGLNECEVSYNDTIYDNIGSMTSLPPSMAQLVLPEPLTEAAKRFGVSYATIKRWKASSKIELIGGLWQLARENAPSHSIAGASQEPQEAPKAAIEEKVRETTQSLPASLCEALMEPVAFSAEGKTLLSIEPVVSCIQTT